MKLRLSDDFNTSNMDPVTLSLVAGALNNSTSSGTTSESGSETAGLDSNTFNVIAQVIGGIQSIVNQAEETRLRELIDTLKSQFNLGAISSLEDVKLLNYAMAFDMEIKRLQAEKAPANTPQGRIDRRYIEAFKILNAAIDAEAKMRGYKRVGSVGTPANQYFLKIEDVVNSLAPGSSAGTPSGSSLVPSSPIIAGIPNIAVIGLVGALAYMLFKK